MRSSPPLPPPTARRSESRSRSVLLIETLEGRTLLTAVTFTLDPAQSEIVLSGTAGGSTLVEQAANSLAAGLSGAILAEVAGTSITFSGGSTITAGSLANPLPGGTPANFGANVQGTAAALAIRDLMLDLTSAGPVAITGGNFSASEETIRFTAGTVAYDPGNGGAVGNASLAGQSFTNASDETGQIFPSLDGTLSLDLPVAGTLTFNDAAIGVPMEFQFTGRLFGVGPLALPSPEIAASVGGSDVQTGGTVDFGTAAPGATATRTITVRNDGSRPLSFAAAAATAPAGFTITQPLPLLIAAGASADLVVALDTSTTGAHAGALTIPNNDSDESTFTLNLSGNVEQPNGVTVSNVAVSGVPARIIGGDRTARAAVAVTLTDVGDQNFSGPVTVTLFASPDNIADASTDTKLAEVTKKLKIKGNAAAKPLKLKVQFPAVAADGDFFLIAQASGTGVAGGQASAVAQSGVVHIERPVVNLVGTGAAPAPLSFTLGKKTSLSLSLMNNGNVAAKGSVNLDLLLSVDGTEASATPLATVPAKVSINPGASKTVKLKTTIPATGATAGGFFVLVRVSGVGPLADLNASNGVLLTPIPVTLVG
jgi:hypothetical protein